MASFERLYTQAAAAGGNQADTEFEARRMAQMAEFIARRWPGTADADAAFSVLVSYAIRNNRIDDAEKLLAEASEHRGRGSSCSWATPCGAATSNFHKATAAARKTRPAMR